VTSEDIIRERIESEFEDEETTQVVSVEFNQAFTIDGTYREVYHVIVSHEYSRETRLEVIRVIIDNQETFVSQERVWAS
jgi:hypothetical protein